MTTELRRELSLAALLAATLAATPVLPPWLEALAVAAVVALALGAWSWRRAVHEHKRLHHQLAGTVNVALVGFAAAFFGSLGVGSVVIVLALATVAAIVAVRARVRLAGGPVPAEGDAQVRVEFEGAAHAVGTAPHIPGTDQAVALWVAQQGPRRWSSTDRVELRGDERRVVIDPAHARVLGAPWLIKPQLARGVMAELDGADTTRPIRVWSIREGTHAFVIGSATREDDPQAPSLRDPGRVNVFSGDVVIGTGRRSEALRHAKARLFVWGAIAACAGALALVG